jgi:GxxExxY protein
METGKTIIKDQYPDSELTGKIIGCAMEVHRHFGNGFQEVVYQRAMAIEMKMQGLSFEREMEMPLYYKGHDVGTRRVDFFVEGKIMVELKAVKQLEDMHLAQAINYLEAYRMQTGLLINFGNTSLQFKRVTKPRPKQAAQPGNQQAQPLQSSPPTQSDQSPQPPQTNQQ